jgi:hypothetical protein
VPNPGRFTYYEAKRCMLAPSNPAADFSKGCAHPMIVHTFLLTHPLTIREVTRVMPATTMISGAGSMSPAPLVRLANDARP